jgi:DNA-directed RNA polymerase specialized sigma24 family protein
MLPEETTVGSFEGFVEDSETRLHDALAALFGPQAGRDATAEALAYGWEHWERVRRMDNPLGYLYSVGRDRGRKAQTGRRVVLMPVDSDRVPWIEPGLPGALGALPNKQRIVVMLLHCYDWTMTEVAEVLGVSKGTVQSYDTRAMKRLRRRLGVTR